MITGPGLAVPEKVRTAVPLPEKVKQVLCGLPPPSPGLPEEEVSASPTAYQKVVFGETPLGTSSSDTSSSPASSFRSGSSGGFSTGCSTIKEEPVGTTAGTLKANVKTV